MPQRRASAFAPAPLLLAALGCTKENPGPAPITVSFGSSSSAALIAAASPPDLCAFAIGAMPESARGDAGVSPDLPYAKCFSGPKGAWTIAPDGDGPNPKGWVAIHVDTAGTVTTKARSYRAARGDTDPDGPSVPAFGWIDEAWAEAFDFDGDGDPELFVGLHGFWSSATHLELAESRLYSFKSGAIVNYPPAAAFTIWKLEDRDEDGRPDILTSSPYATSRGGSDPHFSPALVAHSLPDGTFSTKDTVAEKAARGVCPKNPPLKSLTRTRRAMSEEEEVPLACARMWGTSKAAIAKQLKLDPSNKTDDWPSILDTEPPLILR